MKILEYIHLTLKMLTAILRSCLAVLCSIFCFVSVAQAPSIEDLKLKIYIAPNDSVKGMAYYDLFNATRYKDLPLAIRYADSGLMIFTKLNNDAGIQHRVYLDAVIAYSQGEYQKALDACLKYTDWARSSGNMEREWYAVSMLAMTYRELGDYTEGIKSAQRGIDIGVQLNRDDENAFFYNELGNMYATLKQWDESTKYFKKSYDLGVRIKYPQGQSVSLRNLAANALERKNIAEAEEYILKALSIDSSLSWNLGRSRSYQSLAKLSEQKNNPEVAVTSLRKALGYLTASDHYDLAMTFQALARNFLKQNKIDSAHHYLQFSNGKASNLDAADYVNEQKRLESELFEKKGDYRKAFRALKTYVDKNAQQLNTDIANQITGLNIQFETRHKEGQISLLTAENELTNTKLKASRNALLGLGLGTLLFLALSVSIYRLYQKTKTQNVQIQKALTEKEVLIREIHHRVKNNLQFISSLLNLQSRHIEDQVALNALKEGQNRVKSMALIHQNLYQEDNLTGIETKKYFETLMQNLFQSYNISSEKIKLITNIDTLQIDVDSMIPLGLIMNELISNALKYAFPEPNTGTITVTLTEENGALILKVSDDGIGMSDHSKSQAGHSFGYRLINAFKNQLDADLEIKNEKGTEVVMRIRNYKKAA